MRLAVLIVFAGCAGNVGSNPPAGGDDDQTPPVDGSPGGGDGGGLVPGDLTVAWMHGSQDCTQNADPAIQVHDYNATTHIFRQNKCQTFEAPFVYVLVGTARALVLDTGDLDTPTIRDTARSLVGGLPMLVAHTHAHRDHTRSDPQMTGADITLVATQQSAIQQTFGIASWPTSQGSIDLGGRVLDVLAIPGHEAQHIAIYDRQTGLLLTGDSLYPGLLFISDWTAYRDSIHRLAAFAANRPIAHVLGAHIEMTSTPKVNYPYGTTFQPMEHVLPLTAAHLVELDAALVALGPNPPNGPVAHDDFVIDPQ
jgi:hydroxyacylglutathione hydrolase